MLKSTNFGGISIVRGARRSSVTQEVAVRNAMALMMVVALILVGCDSGADDAALGTITPSGTEGPALVVEYEDTWVPEPDVKPGVTEDTGPEVEPEIHEPDTTPETTEDTWVPETTEDTSPEVESDVEEDTEPDAGPEVIEEPECPEGALPEWTLDLSCVWPIEVLFDAEGGAIHPPKVYCVHLPAGNGCYYLLCEGGDCLDAQKMPYCRPYTTLNTVPDDAKQITLCEEDAE
jgi:hypothetical protein